MAMVPFNDILIVDDDGTMVDFIISALREAGYHCYAAYDGESTLFAIETLPPALVLLDLHLPGLTGLDVVAELRRSNLAHVPIILMTADATAVAELPTDLFPDCLIKPFDLNALLACVARYVPPAPTQAARVVAGVTRVSDNLR